jgi:hypothetical protein
VITRNMSSIIGIKHIISRGSLIPIVICLLLVSACGSSTTTTSKGNKTSTPTATATSTPAPAMGSKPAIPTNGAYLGAWVRPNLSTDQSQGSIASEMAQVPSLEQTIGRPLGIIHDYVAWNVPFPVQTMATQEAKGTIPLVDWQCGDLDANVTAGNDDANIRSHAEALKSYGRPVFLRWYWEMNLKGSPHIKQCLGSEGPSGYVAAWQHIWTIFNQVGVTNAAWVWCPNYGGAKKYYPGNAYVDWIGVDEYNRTTSSTANFASAFSSFYHQWSKNGKPLMIAETGASTNVQAQWLSQAQQTLENQYTGIKAFVYFDAPGSDKRFDWALQGSGLTAFKTMAQSSYFNPPTTQP